MQNSTLSSFEKDLIFSGIGIPILVILVFMILRCLLRPRNKATKEATPPVRESRDVRNDILSLANALKETGFDSDETKQMIKEYISKNRS